MSIPVVSVIVPNYNKGAYIADTLLSVQNQRYTNWECVIMDDGSTDDSLEIIQKVCENDSRFMLHQQSNQGVANARNHAIRLAQGSYILPLDADDIIHADYLSKAMAAFHEHPEVAIIYTDKKYFGAKNGIKVMPEFDIKQMLMSNIVNIASVYKRSVWEAVGGYSNAFIYGAEDRDFWLSAYEHGFQFYKLNEALYEYRVLPNSRDKLYKGNTHKREVTHKLLVKRHIDLYQEQLGPVLNAYDNAMRYKRALEKIHSNPWFKWQFKLWKWFKVKAI